MRAFTVDNCEFEIVIKRCGIYQVPFQGRHHPPKADHCFDLNRFSHGQRDKALLELATEFVQELRHND